MITDRVLLAKIKKENKPEDLETLYKRYLPLIDKYAYKVFSKFETSYAECKEDFRQDAFIAMQEAIKYVSLNKIQDDNWKFGYVFYYTLKNLQKEHRTYLYRYQAVSIDEYYEMEHEHDYDTHANCRSFMVRLSRIMGVQSNHYSEFETEIKEIEQSLTPRQRIILEGRQLGKNIHEIAKELNLSYGAVHRDIQFAKKKAKNLLNITH